MSADDAEIDERLSDVEKALEILMEPNTMTESPSAWTVLHRDHEQRAKYLDFVIDRWNWILATYVRPRAAGKGSEAHTYVTVGIAECWIHHPAVVEEVCALVAAWTEAYHRNSKPTSDPINWHDRWLPHCIARIADYGIEQCTTEQTCHVTGERYATAPDMATRVPA